jgi:hypothetical protein
MLGAARDLNVADASALKFGECYIEAWIFHGSTLRQCRWTMAIEFAA